MRKILCPKCKTETDPRKQMCEYCGKYIIITELDSQDQKTIREISNKNRPELQHYNNTQSNLSRSDSTNSDDLFGELEPLNLDDGTVIGKDVKREGQSSLEMQSNTLDIEQSEVSKPSKEKKKKFLDRSELLKKVQEDYDLFGELDEK